jgi:hypothetical protein
MSHESDQRHDPVRLKRLACTLAAMLLMLHWAAPSFRAFDPLPSTRNSVPAYSQAELGAHRGTLPRLLTRTQTVDAGLSKPKRIYGSPDGASHGLMAGLPFDLCNGNRAEIPGTPEATRAVAPARHFQARAPPAIAA